MDQAERGSKTMLGDDGRMMQAVTVGQGQPQRLPTESEGLMHDRGSLSASCIEQVSVGGKNTERLILLACLLA